MPNNEAPLYTPEDLQNFSSFLLCFTPIELGILQSIIGVFIASYLTIDEQNVMGNFLVGVGTTLLITAAQGSFIQSVNDKQKEIQDKLKEQEQNKKDDEEKEEVKSSIEDLKKQLKQLQDSLNKQLRI